MGRQAGPQPPDLPAARDELRDLIMKHASTSLLRDAARKAGLRSLRESGLMGIYEGLTTIEEVVRETIVEEA